MPNDKKKTNVEKTKKTNSSTKTSKKKTDISKTTKIEKEKNSATKTNKSTSSKTSKNVENKNENQKKSKSTNKQSVKNQPKSSSNRTRNKVVENSANKKKSNRNVKQTSNKDLNQKNSQVKEKIKPSKNMDSNIKQDTEKKDKKRFSNFFKFFSFFAVNRKSEKNKDSKVHQKANKSKNAKNVKKEPLFSKKTKKTLIIVSILCGGIILLEMIYFVYHRIQVDKNTIYYDSLNSVVIDNLDIVAVGSSNFRYSRYNNYTKGLEKAKFIKYDKDGKVIFEKMYEKGLNTTFSSIIAVEDGYVVVGSGEFSEQEQQNGAREAIILKYDQEGNLIWEKFYQVVTNTRFNKVIKTSDGYVAVGQSIYANMEMGNHTTGGGIIMKYDFDGNVVWYNNHGGIKSGNFNDIVEVNGDFYVVGKDATDSANIIKYNSNGEYQWHKNYSYTDGIGFTGIAYLDNALYVVGSKKILPEGTGDDDDRNTENTDALLVKYDLNGNILLEKNFGGSSYERYNSVIVYRDHLYIVGHTSSSDAGMKITTDGELMTGILVCYDKDGNIIKKESFGGNNNDNLTDIYTDGVSLYITGYSNSKNGNMVTSKNNGKDYFGKVIKLDFKFRELMVK